jgi:hypothetical protein
MKTKEERSQTVAIKNANYSIDDSKVNHKKIENTGTDLYETLINNQKFYSDNKNSFEIDLNQIKTALVKDLPENVEIDFVNNNQNFDGSIVTEEISTISILLEKDETCRVTLDLNISSDNGHSDIMASLFHCLKREVILLSKERRPIIEDESQDYLKYSIYIEGETIEELITAAVAFNENISKEIESTIDKTPRFLADYLGLDKSEDLFNSLENFQTT